MKRRELIKAGMGCALLGPFMWGCGENKRRPARVYHFKLAVFGTVVHILMREDTPAPTMRRSRMGAARILMETHSRFTLFEDSPLTRLNGQGADAPQPVHPHVAELTRLGIHYAHETEARFDPTIGALTDLFRGGKRPDGARVKAAQVAVGVRHVRLAGDTVALTQPETALDFNGLVKGWAVDRIAELLQENGVGHFLINAGGDIRAHGNQGDEDGWVVHLQSPLPGGLPMHRFVVQDEALATSGNTKQPRLHLLEPRSGHHVNTLTSATAVAKTTAEADAWSTAAFVGGLDWSRAVGRDRQLYLADKSLRIIST